MLLSNIRYMSDLLLSRTGWQLPLAITAAAAAAAASTTASTRGQRPVTALTPTPATPVTAKPSEIFKVLTPEDFEMKVKRSDKLVIVDFFATWCSPCMQLTPRIESIVGEMGGSVRLAKVDVDEHMELALDYAVMSVPVLMAMRNGHVLNRIVGLQDKDMLRQWINKNVNTSQGGLAGR